MSKRSVGDDLVIAAWPGAWLSLSLFAVRPSPDLAGRTPAQELARRGGTIAIRIERPPAP